MEVHLYIGLGVFTGQGGVLIWSFGRYFGYSIFHSFFSESYHLASIQLILIQYFLRVWYLF